MTTEPDWTRLLQWDQPLQEQPPTDRTAHRRHSYPPATLVVGACGGAGTTVTALGLANALALSRKRVVLVDAAPGGGDLVDRGATTVSPEDGVERLLADLCTGVPVSPSLFAECSSETSVGATIVHQTGDEFDDLHTDPDLEPLDEYLRAHERPTVYDAGRMWRPAHARPLWWLPDDTPIVLTVPSRADAFNRMRYSLELLSSFRGVNRLGSTLVVVSHQRPGVRLDDVAVLRNFLRGRVAGVHTVPYDEELALGTVVDHPSMRPETIAAYDQLAAAIADLAHRSAVRRAARAEHHQP